MVNGVNVNDELNNAQLEGQLGVNGIVTNPIKNPYKDIDKNLLIDETAISNEAITLYEKEQDIKKFSNLVMSDPEDLSHEEIISGLFNKGVSDPLSDEAIEELSINERLLEDLSL
ncbi:MAG: hypothetical protein PHC64_01410 [Candidatus Gastranaerophilales bacterium]|nr:hypothetical protein [Candidatus Gastranaerophilales bacterium]